MKGNIKAIPKVALRLVCYGAQP